jgi:hypothetical protein
MWTLLFGHHEDRTPTRGYEPAREAAMAAFAKSWRAGIGHGKADYETQRTGSRDFVLRSRPALSTAGAGTQAQAAAGPSDPSLGAAVLPR